MWGYLCKVRLIVNTVASNKVSTPYVYAIKSRPCLGNTDKAEGNALYYLVGTDWMRVMCRYRIQVTGMEDLCCEKHFELGAW